MTVWNLLSIAGSFNITAPAAGVIAVWLARQPDRTAMKHWLYLLGFSAGIVIISKLAFIGWGIGIRDLDFTGFSGHSMRAATTFPVLFYLLVAWLHDGSRNLAALAGLILAALIAWSRIEVHAHSVSEAVSGYALGAATSLYFLYGLRERFDLKMHPAFAVLSLLALALPTQLPPVPTQSILIRTALFISGHPAPYIRATWRMAPLPGRPHLTQTPGQRAR